MSHQKGLTKTISAKIEEWAMETEFVDRAKGLNKKNRLDHEVLG